MNDRVTVPDDAPALRRCVRELAALSTLSAVWTHSSLQQIADGLSGVVLRALPLSLAHVCLPGVDGGPDVEVAGTPLGPLPVDEARAIGQALSRMPRDGGPDDTIAYRFGHAELRLLMLPLGHGGECGRLCAASDAAEFPSQTDRLMLGVAANQAAVVLQQRRADQRIRRSERELTDFFDNAAVGLHWVAADGTVIRVNRAELDLLGYTADEYLGRHIADFHADQPVIDDILRRLHDGEHLQDYEARLRCRDGSIKHVLIDSNVLWEDGRFVHTRCFTRDITQRKRDQEALTRQRERLGLMWEAASVLLSAEAPDAMLRGLLATIGPHLGVDVYFAYLSNERGEPLHLLWPDGVPGAVARQIARLDYEEATRNAAAMRRQPLLPDHRQTADDPRAYLVKSLGVRAYACMPLVIGDRLLGTLAFGSRARDRFDDAEIAFIETLCHYVTVAGERLRLLDELKESDRRKDEFLATLAHELRNPLAPIRSAVKVLDLTGADNPEARWSRGVIERQVEHLTRLIDDLLEISRITRNELELRKRCVEFSEVITGAIEASRPLIEASGHELVVSLPSEPVYLDADLVRLAQVFLNLLNNAAKYTDRGGRIWLTAERHDATLIVRVKDTGVGIAPDKLPRLFEMFYQVDRSLERSQGGLGIGLSLVRRLVEFHGGGVQAYSDGAGTGSEFVVTLPVRAREPERPGAPDPSLRPAAASRILVVDDNRDSAESLSMFLRLNGNEVETAYDGVEAVEAAERFRPDAVLLDIGMPRLNGEDACRQIRAASWGRGMVLVALTGWGQEEDRRRTVDAGFDAHLVKPVDPDEVIRLLASRARAAG